MHVVGLSYPSNANSKNYKIPFRTTTNETTEKYICLQIYSIRYRNKTVDNRYKPVPCFIEASL